MVSVRKESYFGWIFLWILFWCYTNWIVGRSIPMCQAMYILYDDLGNRVRIFIATCCRMELGSIVSTSYSFGSHSGERVVLKNFFEFIY